MGDCSVRESEPPPPPLPMMFSTGDAVEVTSDDEGFRGAWYEAVVARSMPRAGRYTVVYDHLLTDDGDNPRPLRETVDAAYVRPCPPRHGGPFAPHRPVDAWYNDGWWVGVVGAAVLGSGKGKGERYIVYFPSSREEIEFKAADLRAHLEWVENEWVVPDESTPGTVAMAFPLGTKVEVSRNIRDSLPAWFVATVERHIWKNNLMVRYQSLQADDKEECLKEIVDVKHARPCPPGSKFRNFGLLEEVEVFHDDGWCMGLVSRSCGGGRYIVKSKHWDGEMEFCQNDMRLRHECTDGHWVLATKEILGVFEVGTKVEVSSDDEGFCGAWYAGTIVQLLSGNMFVVEYEALRTDDETELLKENVDAHHIRPAPKTLVVKEFKKFEEVDAYYNDGWWIGVISRVLEGSRYVVYFRNTHEELEFGHNELRPHVDWINGNWIRTTQALSL